MSKFTRELEELQANGVITPETADRIRAYYERPSEGRSLLVIAFGVIGALLVGMGIVLIIAHNWDVLSVPMKLFFGLTPLFVTQGITAVIIFKQIQNKSWREAAAVLLIFAVATAIAIVSQVYNIEGSLESFLVTWMLLILPIMYLLRSSAASILYWVGITWYATEAGYDYRVSTEVLTYGLLALPAIPFYLNLIRRNPDAASIFSHNWVIAVSVTVALGIGAYMNGGYLLVGAYITLFSIFMMIGQLPYFEERKLGSNSWLVIGSAGIIIILLVLTFDWQDLSRKTSSWWWSVPMYMWVGLMIGASVLLSFLGNRIGFRNVLSKSYTYLIYLVLFLIGLSDTLISRGLTNVLILALGVYTIREGALANKLWKMNYGMLIVALLIVCRFFDTDMSFVIRGLLFVGIGGGFFGMNYYMAKKRKAV